MRGWYLGVHNGGNGWLGLQYFSVDGKIITEIKQVTVESLGLLSIYPD